MRNTIVQDWRSYYKIMKTWFEEPTELPPHREGHDHKIPLLEGSNPVNQRPYRYALYQKT